MCPQWIQSAQGYKLSLRKNTEDMPLKSERKHNSLTSYYCEARHLVSSVDDPPRRTPAHALAIKTRRFLEKRMLK